jgi:hypothetical protein
MAMPNRIKPGIKIDQEHNWSFLSPSDHHDAPPRCCVCKSASMTRGGILHSLLILTKTEKNIMETAQISRDQLSMCKDDSVYAART